MRRLLDFFELWVAPTLLILGIICVCVVGILAVYQSPNNAVLSEVEEYSGVTISDIHQWDYLCERWREETNTTEKCWVTK